MGLIFVSIQPVCVFWVEHLNHLHLRWLSICVFLLPFSFLNIFYVFLATSGLRLGTWHLHCHTRASLWLWCMGLVALWALSSLIRDHTPIPCIGRWILKPWTTREVPRPHLTAVFVIVLDLFLLIFLSSVLFSGGWMTIFSVVFGLLFLCVNLL